MTLIFSYGIKDLFYLIKFFFSLFGWTTQQAGTQFPDQGSKWQLMQWKHGVLTARLPGKSQHQTF